MLQGHYCQLLTKHEQIVTKYYQNDQIHVEKIQERHFLRIKKQRKPTGGEGGGYREGLGV